MDTTESQLRQQSGGKLVLILLFTTLISAMSASMFNIILPEIRSDFQLTFAEVSWISSSYMLLYAVGSVIYGKLADIYKLKNLITFGLFLFSFGSFIGLTAHAFWMVLSGRIVQAVGAAVIPATAVIIPTKYFPPEKRGKAMGTVSGGLALGLALGPVLASLLLSFAHWRWLFFVPLFTLFVIPFFRKHLLKEQKKPGHIDWVGAALLAGTVVMLLLSITYEDWIPGIGSTILLIWFMLWIKTRKNPFIQPVLFKNRRYSLGLVISFLVNGMGYSIPFLTPLLLARVHQLPSELIGLTMVPASLAAAVFSRKGGSLADAKGNPFLFYISMSLLLVFFFLMSSLNGFSPGFIAVFLILGQMGQIFMIVVMSNTISQTLPNEHAGVGMGLLAMLNFVGNSLSVGVYSKAVDLGSGIHFNPVHAHLFRDGVIFSNIYLVLAALYVCIFMLYHAQFGRASSNMTGLKDNQTV